MAFFVLLHPVMSTIIYPSPIFGPVHSRRLGISLGINLLPADGKVCSFDCIYCECGFNKDHRPTLPFPKREEVAKHLEETLRKMVDDGQLPDVLTFAGNGEPTCHPQFAEIIDDTIRLRDQYCPKAKVSVLSNSTFIHHPQVHEALMRVDNNILKLDTIDPTYIQKVDRPNGAYDVQMRERNMLFILLFFQILPALIFAERCEDCARICERYAKAKGPYGGSRPLHQSLLHQWGPSGLSF